MSEAAENPSSLGAIAKRLRLTREALGLNQAELCRRTGIKVNTWNQYEKAKSRISLDEAEKLWRAEQITLDWIYHGLIGLMPSQLADRIRELQAHDASSPNQDRQSA